MATMIDWSQLQSKITLYKELYDCENESIALAYIILEHTLSLSPEEISDAITDGSMDRGIDAVFVDERGEKILSTSSNLSTKRNLKTQKTIFLVTRLISS